MPSTGSSSSVRPAEVAAPGARLVVGVTSYNNAETIGDVVRGVLEAIGDESPLGTARLVLADGGSSDKTVASARQVVGGARELVVLDYPRPDTDPLKAPFHGLPGRPDAVRAVLQDAVETQAAACVILDGGVSNVTSDWIARLATPALTGDFDYVSAYYSRRPAEGALTKSIVYPVFRALYNVRLRQPAALEFGCSSRLMAYYLDHVLWTGDEAQSGVDLWLASAAASGGYRICEAALGVRTSVPRPGAPDLSTTLKQVVGALFLDLEGRADEWQRLRHSAPVPQIGEPPPGTADVRGSDPEELIEAFRLGYRALSDVWAWILPPRTILRLKRLADTPPDAFRIPDEIWARIVYDFALGYRIRAMSRDHLFGSLTPLYLGWLASFVLETTDADQAAADARLEQLCLAFEAEKPYLISRWRWPERFRS